jgi:hypothetical protein
MFQWQRLLIVVHGLIPGRFFNDPLDVDYNVDLGGAGGGDEIADSAEAREHARADAEDYIPPDEGARGARGDEEHEEQPVDDE